MKINQFEQLDCWKAAREMMQMVFTTVSSQQLRNEFELKGRFIRAGLSVMNNIAEGFGRFHRKDFIRFLNVSLASANELRSMTYVLLDQQFITAAQQSNLVESIVKTQNLTGGLIRYLKSSDKAEHMNT
ncbi:MAG: four helix bundle protein [Saprospiraceae bacterium]|nr:four helix bundle protein [Saprospiraceae bacterium]